MNLPNKLTVIRIFMIPIFMIVVLAPWDWGTLQVGNTDLAVTQLVGAIIFAIASYTDHLDGKIARRDGLVTNFGKFADPLADKMLVMTAFIILVEQGKAPSWVLNKAAVLWQLQCQGKLRLRHKWSESYCFI